MTELKDSFTAESLKQIANSANEEVYSKLPSLEEFVSEILSLCKQRASEGGYSFEFKPTRNQWGKYGDSLISELGRTGLTVRTYERSITVLWL